MTAEDQKIKVEIPYTRLSQEVLSVILDEFILQEGTDYGLEEYSLEQKRTRVLKQLENGKAIIVWDPETETTNIVTKG
ncbi:MAG: YheU family protein [Bdellovibrionales bacterium]|nr:YheU family protein [Bdellovibrionales bacterium]